MKRFMRGCRCPGQDSNPGLPDYELGVVRTHSRFCDLLERRKISLLTGALVTVIDIFRGLTQTFQASN